MGNNKTVLLDRIDAEKLLKNYLSSHGFSIVSISPYVGNNETSKLQEWIEL